MTDIKSYNLTPSHEICYNDGKSMTEQASSPGRSGGGAEKEGRANATASLKF